MYSFEDLLELLKPDECYDPVRGKCRQLWNALSEQQQNLVYRRIEEKKNRKEFVDYNPLFAIKKNSAAPQPQTLSYADYYARYGTTEEKDGWHMANPTGNKVIYVKN